MGVSIHLELNTLLPHHCQNLGGAHGSQREEAQSPGMMQAVGMGRAGNVQSHLISSLSEWLHGSV